jgi:hypothetical protein
MTITRTRNHMPKDSPIGQYELVEISGLWLVFNPEGALSTRTVIDEGRKQSRNWYRTRDDAIAAIESGHIDETFAPNGGRDPAFDLGEISFKP